MSTEAPTFNELFGIDPERQALNREMNQRIVGDFNAGRRFGSLGATAQPTPTAGQRREQLATALDYYERAQEAGDQAAINRAEFHLAESHGGFP
jgi:hypothetical protein